MRQVIVNAYAHLSSTSHHSLINEELPFLHLAQGCQLSILALSLKNETNV
jgi:hypothetical protein